MPTYVGLFVQVFHVDGTAEQVRDRVAAVLRRAMEDGGELKREPDYPLLADIDVEIEESVK